MTWQNMIDESLGDIKKILSASLNFGNRVEHIIAMVQWHGQEYATRVFMPTDVEVISRDDGLPAGMSVFPEPPELWFRSDIGWRPKANGDYTKEDSPLAYYVIGKNGSGVCFASRFHDGKLNWIHSEEHIDLCRDRLLVAGVWKFKP